MSRSPLPAAEPTTPGGTGRSTAPAVEGRVAAPLLGLGAVVLVLAFLASDPVVLARLGGQLQAARAGAEFHGRGGLTLQSGLHDCGPAALSNLLSELGVDPPPLDSLARLAGTRHTGTRMSGLVRAAGASGIALIRWSRGSAAGPDGTLPTFPLPSIAWVRQSHFVTVTAEAPDGRLVILDPLVGRYSMTAADFRRIWSGEVLLVPRETPPLVATSVAASFPIAGGFHATSPFGTAHVVPGRRLRDTPSSRTP